MSTAVKTTKLSKIYEGALRGRDVHALKALDLEINEGEIFAYLGPNGSGKTTTIKIILGLLFPTSGSLEVFGAKNIHSAAVKRNIGYLPEGAYYPEFLRGEEVIEYYGKLYGLHGRDLKRRLDEVIDLVGLAHARKRLVRSYSKGMRQRVGLAQALISDPKLLILDEPTTGLDPIARKEIRDILANLRNAGKTLLISSHELLEAEMISDRAGILYEGVLQAEGRLDELLLQRDIALEVDGLTPELVEKSEAAGLRVEDRLGERGKLRAPEGLSAYDAIRRCGELGLKLVSVAPRRETLEELFVRVIGAAKTSRSA
ncbi:MAG TPA: ABC transporter ATP-binding protein [Candidatus Hydrogenedentes bacterium]|nr:ABC transporter ATP-binding protein [Candidatus Hydrogenedentota bacterium]HQL94131.1 ABC transporter ATP-binding protein [Candidatus Hydrogenedentota bacterium]HRZ82196.1 ABC transporter ATP-binding protein [Candidatus Hydrogenedentota bacterium]